MQRCASFIYLSLGCYVCVCSSAYAQESDNFSDDMGVFNIVMENDSFANEDRDYTNGIRVAMVSSEERMPVLIQKIAHILPLANDGQKRIGIAAGQSMFAPEDISRTTPLASDHPYAGWLYGSVGMVSDTGTTLDNVMLTLGVVGPMSYAEQSQKFVHHVIDSPQPQGWDSQLRNELGVVLTYERKWRGLYELSPFGVGIDVTPHVGVNVGNVNTDASAGATFRVGYDLPADYGPPRIRPSLPGSDFFIPTKELGGYLFTTVGEQAVVRNIFLDGNTFRDDPHVNKETWVGSVQVGAAMTYGLTRLSYTQVFMTKEYATQEHASEFGVITLSHRF